MSTHNTLEALNQISGQIVDAAMKVHSHFGPGLLESAYEVCLAYELCKRGLKALTQVTLPIVYDDVQLDAGYRLDILVEDSVIVELKTVEAIAPIHEAQIISCLKLSGKHLGLLLNFKVARMRDGIYRYLNNLNDRQHHFSL